MKKGAFNNFLNSDDDDTPPSSGTMRINIARYLTNEERAAFRRDANAGKKGVVTRMDTLVKRKMNTAASNAEALRVTPMKLGFFNAIVNKSFDDAPRIDLVSIFNKRPHARQSIPGTSLSIEVKNIKLYFGRFKVGAESSLTGTFGKVDPKVKYFMVQISAHVYDGAADQGITFRMYKNGKIHFSGGILNNNIKQPEQIRKYIVDTFTQREPFLYNPIVYNNTVGQCAVNGTINLMGVARAFAASGKVEYEPELRPALRMNYRGVSFQLFMSGIVQLMGVKTARGMLEAYEAAKDLMDQLVVMGLLRVSAKKVPKSIAKKKQVKVVTTNKNASNVAYDANKNVLMIGKKTCGRYLKPDLVAAAKKIGVVNIKATTTKEKICEMIKDHVFGGFKVENRPCLGYTRAQLVPLAIAKGITVTDSDTVQSLCAKLQAPPVAPKKPVKPVKNKNAAVLVKRRMTNSTIKENLTALYGKKWLNTYKNVMPSLNKNVANIKARVAAVKGGLPLKKEIDAIKKRSVREWKLARKNALNNKLDEALADELDELLESPSPKKKMPRGTKVEYL